MRRVAALSFARRADQKSAKLLLHIAVFDFTTVVAIMATLATWLTRAGILKSMSLF